MKFLMILLFAFSLLSCEGSPFGMPGQIGQGKVAGGGFIAGVAAQKTKDKIVKVLTPDYPFYWKPLEMCVKISVETVKCDIVPCAPSDTCQLFYSAEEFDEYSPWFVSSKSISHLQGSIIEHYKQHKDAVIRQLGKYQGEKFVIY